MCGPIRIHTHIFHLPVCPALANCQLSWHVGSLLTFSLMRIPHKHDKHKYPFGRLHSRPVEWQKKSLIEILPSQESEFEPESESVAGSSGRICAALF